MGRLNKACAILLSWLGASLLTIYWGANRLRRAFPSAQLEKFEELRTRMGSNTRHKRHLACLF
jgi:hypothetical protein